MPNRVVKRKYNDLPKVVNKSRSVAAPKTFKALYGKEEKVIKCNKESCKGTCTGILRPVQWNRLVCSVCDYSQLA